MKLINKDETIVYPSLLRLIGLLILGLVLVLFGVLFVIIGFDIDVGIDTSISEGYSRHFIGGFGIICCLFFGVCIIYILKRLIVREPSVVINKNGFTDNASAVSIGFIKWEEIRDFRVYKFNKQKFLGIELTDVEETFKRIPRSKRIFLNMNKGLSASLINIPQSTVNIPLEKIYDKMAEYKCTSN